MPGVQIAAKLFDEEMKRSPADRVINDNASLLAYLTVWGERFISSFEEFCQLAELLQTKGYKVSNPPCSFVKFNELVLKANSSNELIDKRARTFSKLFNEDNDRPLINRAVDGFNKWMQKNKNSDEMEQCLNDDNQALLVYLNRLNIFDKDNGFQFIKTYGEFCQLAALVQSQGYKTTNPPCSPLEFGKAVYKALQRAESWGSKKVYGDKKPIMPPGVKPGIAAERFDEWMQRDNEHRQKAGHYDDNNKALLDYLHLDLGFEFIKNYHDFCQLAALVQAKGYKTTNPPCTPAQFGQTLVETFEKPCSHGHEKMFASGRPEIPKGSLVGFAVELFDEWMHKHTESHEKDGHYDDNNKALLQFMTEQFGFRFIKSYEDFCQFSVSVQAKGYKTINPPCTQAQFAEKVLESVKDERHFKSEVVFGYGLPLLPGQFEIEEVSSLRYNFSLFGGYRPTFSTEFILRDNALKTPSAAAVKTPASQSTHP